ncbi:NAD(P)-dependent oxidoreductase [Crossiella cryophila]|uniref:Putative NADH-flavin reductase n=1 Tax=Crossiella cryophila TaxID=43355 RepID=A0A7W7CDN8_9PSEU|nr:NAD(P)H-binding protein [Crossiella cryophila]MBB4679272.1 putative NADH-flavin reductase [Crossiella cryophila]
MRITVFGATGATGSRVVAEAVTRGHQVTAVARSAARFPDLHPGATHRAADATDPAAIAALAAETDLVITATRPRPGREPELVQVTEALFTGLRERGVRLLLVGGSASLRVATGELLVDTAEFPTHLRPIALACKDQHAVAEASTGVDWTYLSPPMLLEPGVRTGRYRVGKDDLLINEQGESAISMEDFAVALLDEAEQPRHRGRFTVAY